MARVTGIAARRAWLPLMVISALVVPTAATVLSQAGGDAAKAPPPAFADPGRRAKLTGALPEIDRLFRDFQKQSRVPGIAWGVLVDGELVQTGTAGYRDLASKAPVERDTVFRIASMTKSFTAMAILELRDEGKLSLDDQAERYVWDLAGLGYPTLDSPRLTIRHLLSHAAGFPEDNPWGDQQLAATEDELTAMLRRGIPFSRPPGLAYEYSNLGFALLGRIVSVVSGRPYADYIADNILRPLGMTSTTLERATVPPSRLAHGYRWEGEQWKEEPLLPDGAFGSMGGMLTSIGDLGRYVAFHLSAWPPRNEPEAGPIRRASAREMQEVWRAAGTAVTRRTVDGPVVLSAGGYGFGLRVSQTCELGHVVSHGGGLPGFGSHMRWLPDHGVGIIALGNLTYTSWGGVADRAIEAFRRTGALQPRMPQPAPVLLEMRDAVSQLIIKWDDGLAQKVAAVNLFLDESADRRRRQFEELRARHGACLSEPVFDAENALRGEWKMQCERGWLQVAITLAPTLPPKVQYLAVRSVMPMDARMAGVVSQIAAALAPATNEPAPLDALLAPAADRAATGRMLGAAARWGACRPAEVLDGDGTQSARVRLTCERGALDLSVSLDAASGKVTRLVLAPAGGNACGQ